MSITNDIRNYADTALEQGKQVVGQAVGAVGTAQAQFNEITGTARSNVGHLTTRASGAVTDLRTQAEKTLNLDAIRTAVEPYLAQAKQYRASVTDRAEGLFGSVKSDKRVAKVVETAESFTGVVFGTVNDRVVKPVSALTGRGAKPASKPAAKKSTTAKKTTAKKASKPAATRPAAKKTTAAKSPAKKTAAKKATS
jgi:hypothetical protein